MNEATLLEATRLWTEAIPAISAFITSLVRDFRDRDDVLQETAVAVMTSFSRYDRQLPFVAWAIGIARHQVMLYLRKKGRDRLVFDTETVDQLAAVFAERPGNREQLQFLNDCIQRLDRPSQELCQLRYSLNLKPAAIGERLKMEPNTVAKALQRIRDRLRQCIEFKARTEMRT